MVQLTGTNGFFFDFLWVSLHGGGGCVVVVVVWVWRGCGVLICGSGFWVVVLQWRHGTMVVAGY